MDHNAQDLFPLESTVRELQADFEGACLALAREIASANDPSDLLELVTALSRGSKSDRELGEEAEETPETDECEQQGDTDEFHERVSTLLVPQVAEILINRSFATTKCAERVNAFLQFALSTCVKCLLLPGVAVTVIPTLVALLDAHSPFYLYHSCQSFDPSAGKRAESDDQDVVLADAGCRFVRPDHITHTSGFFLSNLEAWGMLGGFSAFVEMLRGAEAVERRESHPTSEESAEETQTTTSLAFDAVQNVLRVVYNTKDHVRPEFQLGYLPQFADAVADWVERTPSETLVAIPRDALLEIVHVLELIQTQVQQQCSGPRGVTPSNSADNGSSESADAIDRSLHVLRLDIFLAFFTSGSLEKRIYGFTEIIGLVTRLYNSQVHEQEEPTASSLQLALSHVIDWMHSRQVIEALFGAKLHVELIKRSTPLLQFASELECLSPIWLDCVWRCYQGGDSSTDSIEAGDKSPNLQRHSSLRTLMHNLLLELVAFVELPLLEHLLSRLERISERAIDETHLSLYSAIALRSFEVVEDESSVATVFPLQERILLHLWGEVLPALDGQHVQEQVLIQIPEILRLTAATYSSEESNARSSTCASANSTGQLAGRLLVDCITNIRSRARVPVSLQLLTQVAQLVMEGCVVMEQRSNPNTSYVQVILEELAAFKQDTQIRLEMDSCVQPGMTDEDLRALSSLAGYLERVKMVLFALKGAWIIDCSEGMASSFGQVQADKLWDLLVHHAVLNDEASLCFQWIKFCLKSPPYGQCAAELVSSEIAQYLLISKFKQLPSSRISMPALNCFQALFSAVNVAIGGLETFVLEPSADENASTIGGSDISVDLVSSPRDLVGMGELWHLTMHAVDPRVAEECVTQLVGCYLDVAPSLRGSELQLQSKRDLMERCMQHLRGAMLERAGSEGEEPHVWMTDTVHRCLDLLRYFLEACRGQHNELEGSTDIDGDSSGSSVATRREYVIDSLEENLPFMDVYPSPMRDSAAAFSEQSVFGTARRPSWTFRHQHPHSLLDCVIDEFGSKEEETGDASGDRVVSAAQSLLCGFESLGESVPSISTCDSSGLRSPSLRPRVNLMQPPSPSPQRGPILSVDDISLVLVERDDAYESEDGPRVDVSQRARPRSSKFDDMSYLLANEGTSFQTLLELVDSGEPATARRAWELLCLLPTNNALLRKMIQLRAVSGEVSSANQVDWDDLLCRTRVYRLVYALRLVEALLIPTEDNAAPPSDAGGSTDVARRQWRERFVRLGGAKHVYDTLLEWTRHPADALGKHESPESVYLHNLRATCLAGMLRTMDYFLKLAQSPSLQQSQRCEFDRRLGLSTMPAFLSSFDVSGLFRTVMGQTIAACSGSEVYDEVDELVLAGVEMCCSLVQLKPARVLQSIRGDSTASRLIREWVKAVLVDYPRASTREKAANVLLKLSGRVADVPGDGTVEDFIDIVRNASCAQVIAATNEEPSDCEQLLKLCCSLFCRSRSDPFSNEAEAAATTVDLLMEKLSNSSHSNSQGTLIELLTAMVQSSDTVRSSVLHWKPHASRSGESISIPTDDNEWVMLFLMDRVIFAGSENRGETPQLRPSSQDRATAQRLALALLFPDNHLEVSQPSSAAVDMISSVLLRQERFHASVAQQVDRMGRPWSFSSQESLQSAGTGGVGRAGLVNPGCVCYMNSLLQQLFNMPGFFSGLLALDCSPSSVQKESEWHKEVHELQQLFAALGHTSKRSCDPTAFALSHRDLDGNATDLHTQMDADEFFCLLLDRVETFITSSNRADTITTTSAGGSPASTVGLPTHFLDECFGGVLVNQILTENGHLSEREERFFALSLEITRKHHLADSLALYVQGELLDGENAYYCEREQRKVSATKRICVKTLPRTLVCHLKRFEFDFDTMEKLKINDRLEFPMEIDMFPYTSGAISRSESAKASSADYAACMYDLVGVVVHSGTSDMGHYYSFIKDRRSGGEGSWFECNDEAVRPFDVEAMEDECFGGDEVRQKWDPHQGAFVPAVETKRRSAYMLIYEMRQVPSLAVSQGLSSAVVAESFSPNVKELVRDLQLENQRLDSVAHAFGDQYEAFVVNVLRCISSRANCDETLCRAYQCACEYLFGVRALSNRQGSTVGFNTQNVNSGSATTAIADSVCRWLAGGNESETGSASDNHRVQFCEWLFDKATATISSSDREGGESRDECARSWLFDVLYLSDSDPELLPGCLRIVSGAVETVMRFLKRTGVGDYTTNSTLIKLSSLFRALLDAVYSRHRELIVHEPVCDGAVAIQTSKACSAASAVVDVLTRVLCILPGTLEPEGATQSCRDVLHHVISTQGDFAARFLTSMETMVDRNLLTLYSNTTRSVHDGAQTPAGLHLQIIEKEKRIFLELVRWQDEREGPNELLSCTEAFLRRSVVKGLVLAGCEEIVSRFAVQIAHHGDEIECDRILSLLLTVLEDVRPTPYANTVIKVLEDVLEFQSHTNNADEDTAKRHQHIVESMFSPGHGLLESAAYYKHRPTDREHVFALLQLVVRTTASSAVLRELFATEPQWQTQVKWLVEWLVGYVDPTGAITRRKRSDDGTVEWSQTDLSDEDQTLSAKEASDFILMMEVGLNVAVFTDGEGDPERGELEERTVTTTKSESHPTAASDLHSMMVEGVGENQSELTVATAEWTKGSLTRKDAVVQQQPEDDDGEAEQGTHGASNRAKVPRLTLDLDCSYINYSEA